MYKKLIILVLLIFSLNISYTNVAVAEDDAGEELEEEEEQEEESEEEKEEQSEAEKQASKERKGIKGKLEAISQFLQSLSFKNVQNAILEGTVDSFFIPTIGLFDILDKYLFDMSSYRDNELYKEHKFSFVMMGFYLSIICFVASLLYLMAKGEKAGEAFKESLFRFVSYLFTVLFFVFYVGAVVWMTDALTTPMFSSMVKNDVYKASLEDYEDRLIRYKKLTPERTERIQKAKDGEVLSSVAIIFSFFYNALLKDNIFASAAVMIVEIAVFFVLFGVLVFYAVFRLFLIIALIILAPILFAIPILPVAIPIDPFKAILKLAFIQFGLVSALCISFIFFSHMTEGVLIAVVPLMALPFTFYIMHQAGKIIKVETLDYKMGIPYARKIQNLTQKTVNTTRNMHNKGTYTPSKKQKAMNIARLKKKISIK